MNNYEINENTAKLAKEMNSFSDYKPNSATNEYNDYLKRFNEDIEELIKKYPQNVNEETLELVEQYKDRYAKKLAFAINKRNSIETMMPSILISGGGNFNNRRKEKQNNARHKFWEEYGDLFDEDNYYYNKIRTLLSNSTIYSNDALAIEKLTTKIEDLTELQEHMKKVNAYYKKHQTLEGCDIITEKEFYQLKRHMELFSYQHQPYASFTLTNNNQNIHRLKERLDNLQKLKERAEKPTENKYQSIEGLTINEDATDMRIRLVFDDIPNENTRTLLKSYGFKWSPKNSAWQRQLTANGIYSTKRLLEELAKLECL